jgi:hypothetical protein
VLSFRTEPNARYVLAFGQRLFTSDLPQAFGTIVSV